MRSAFSELSPDTGERTQEGTKCLHVTLKMWCLCGLGLRRTLPFPQCSFRADPGKRDEV